MTHRHKCVHNKLEGIIKGINLNIPFSKPLFALEIPVNIKDNFPKPLLESWGNVPLDDTYKWFIKAQELSYDIGTSFISIYFNYDECDSIDSINLCIEKSTALLDKIQNAAELPLIIRGSGQKNFDKIFLPSLIKSVKVPSIIAFAQENNYKEIIYSINNNSIKDDIYLVLRAPIDINLTKELNILSIDEGMKTDRIIIDTDTGCVGMGLDYGYSIIERICIARKENDDALNAPVIVFSGEETYKAKESKSFDFNASWGNVEERSSCWEIATTNALIMAGANIAVCWNPVTIKTVNGLYGKAGSYA